MSTNMITNDRPSECQDNGNFFFLMKIFGNLKKKSRFGQFFDIQIAIFRMVRCKLRSRDYYSVFDIVYTSGSQRGRYRPPGGADKVQGGAEG